ncbi:hypothetical protein Poli38472_012945 [Pythium oligandrum]|uniref:Enoyl reductase (ER) domain-containing protein n=1 Tax=Pythium oligandrum TaxID=41045 RepID=A0A8K1CJY3_PYTOL|nr:hypothetical protein Poli38472_012945 [Pythium oligandrum]|eukprot:TMW64323.1 hypothetical protein Poli38472_012945 [Pythium oligandrum]
MAITTISVPATYRAYVHEAFGDVHAQVKLRTDIPQETLKADQVRIRVHTAALNPLDYELIEWGSRILPVSPTPEHPFRIGFDVAGVIAEVGSDLSNINVGDDVLALTDFASKGTFAEYLVVAASNVFLKPATLSFHEAAGLPLAGKTSYQALTAQGQLQNGQRVLILGGSTTTGTLAIQIAKALGASFVAATTSTRNVEIVQSLGAEQVIDYTTDAWADVLDTNSIDLIYDCGVEPNAWNDAAQRVLKVSTGRFVSIGQALTTPIESPIGATYVCFRTQPTHGDVPKLIQLVESNQLRVPIDSVYAFDQLVDAFKALKTGCARGKIILKVADTEP